jgi:TRAP-type C4-dicarboxylate transport system permease small subunit
MALRRPFTTLAIPWGRRRAAPPPSGLERSEQAAIARPAPRAARGIVRRAYGWLDGNLEYSLMNLIYILCTLVVFVEAVRRYVFRSQFPWSGQAAIYLFIWLSWVGCAYGVKTRGHLRFDEIRRRLPYTAQFALQLVDYVVWVGLGAIISVTAIQQMLIQADMGSVVQGTDHFPLWVAFLGVPLGWGLVLWRTLQCAAEDIRRFRAGEPLARPFSLQDSA